MQIKDFINESVDYRRLAFTSAASRLSLIPQSVEKDWWVTVVLASVFSLEYASSIHFKGGTSLGKCWDMIQRMSEDIDLALNPELLGFGEHLSKSQVSNKLRRASKQFILEKFVNDLKKSLERSGIPTDCLKISDNDNGISTQDPMQIYIEYPTVFSADEYVVPRIVLEISGRSNKAALAVCSIHSMMDDVMPRNGGIHEFEVTAVLPQRTFIEKVCLLHEEFNKSHGEIRYKRMSRHLYDLFMMCEKGIDRTVLGSEELFRNIIGHRFIYNRVDGVDYNTETPGHFSIIPPGDSIRQWEQDYRNTISKMIYGEKRPDFQTMIARIRKLNDDLNAMQWKETPEFIPGK